MGQKIHPLGFRLSVNKNYRSHWFAKTSQYSQLVLEDQFLRKYLFERFHTSRISTIEIKRKVTTGRITIEITVPERFIYGKGIYALKDIKKDLKRDLKSQIKIFRAENFNLNVASNNFKKIENQKLPGNTQSIDLSIEIITLAKKHRSASFIADLLVLQFEKRKRFRPALRRAIRCYRRANVEGIKIQISGRLNGAEIARTEWIRKGRVPLQTLRADIDYSYKTAKTIYGLLGIKIWVFKGVSKKTFNPY